MAQYCISSSYLWVIVWMTFPMHLVLGSLFVVGNARSEIFLLLVLALYACIFQRIRVAFKRNQGECQAVWRDITADHKFAKVVIAVNCALVLSVGIACLWRIGTYAWPHSVIRIIVSSASLGCSGVSTLLA